MATHTLPKSVTTEDYALLLDQVSKLTQSVEDLNKKFEESINRGANRNRDAQREMTDDDARRIMTGDLKDAKHNDAAAKLGLSYGQVYSCRLGYTFKHIHKEMKEKGEKSAWMKE